MENTRENLHKWVKARLQVNPHAMVTQIDDELSRHGCSVDFGVLHSVFLDVKAEIKTSHVHVPWSLVPYFNAPRDQPAADDLEKNIVSITMTTEDQLDEPRPVSCYKAELMDGSSLRTRHECLHTYCWHDVDGRVDKKHNTYGHFLKEVYEKRNQ